ncbi:hypothetical protein PRVXT_000933 [Proteinivorax tanatarense]|uniref:Shikimate dehydrogenase substrate binding N-terminal domain-containing protein n=1 Tax=Proteinivorax tanatarense TaxID=1260629 RepID=A0AAU7VPN1_9FIRM
MDKYCVIGDPIDHSLSPKIHNCLFKHYGLNACYTKFRVSTDNLKEKVDCLIKEGYKGFNVTYPLKAAIKEHIDQISYHGKNIASVNTVALSNGKLLGDNTDFRGMQLVLDPFRSEEIYILGSGNMAHTTIYALKEFTNRNITVVCRNKKAGENLKKQYPWINLMSIEFFKKENISGGVTVNTLPLNLDISHLFENKIAQVLLDCNYNQTVSLSNDLQYISGLELLYAQAIKSFEIWTGYQPTLETLKELLKKYQQS